MFPLSRLAVWPVAALAAAWFACGAALAQQPAEKSTSPRTAAPAREPQPKLPLQDLSEPILYEFLLGEIAAQRGSPGIAAQTYVDLAKRTRDPRIARRAVEIANQARMQDLALEAARLWHDIEPASPQALQTVTLLLVGTKRVDEAEPYLAKLLATDPNAAANGFMQLGRLLAGNQDTAANLRVVQRLAARYPELAQAHFALAQAALAANDEALALSEIRRASELRPDWEAAAVYEAQLLQRRSPAEAAKRLDAFLEKYPDSRDVRLNYARALAVDKRFAESRAEFDKILARNRDDTDAIYAVGLLAMQVKDYPTAEASMKRLLEIGYRDPEGVRYTLGQIAEEQKEWPRAIEWYKTIRRGDHAMPARMRTANALAKQGKLEEARAFLKAVKTDDEPQRVQLIIAESQLLREANLHRDAFALLGEALKKNPDQPELLYDHALTAERIDRFDVLEANLKRLIELRPEHAHAYNALGYSLADRNLQLPEARKLIEKALELAPEDYFIIDSMGWVLYRQGDLAGAAQQLKRAWRGRPDGEIGAHLGEVLWMMGERAEAERIWKEAQQASPENETLQKTIKRFGK
jgi:tetratricopeptide (TPR) repeat protein